MDTKEKEMSGIKFEYGFESVNGIVKKVYYLHEIPNIQQKCDIWNCLPIKYVRQFTGLKDKNGKDIYEGDILQMWDTKIEDNYFKNTVVWVFGSFGYFGNDGNFYAFSTHTEIIKPIITDAFIIGNVYENPELLTP